MTASSAPSRLGGADRARPSVHKGPPGPFFMYSGGLPSLSTFRPGSGESLLSAKKGKMDLPRDSTSVYAVYIREAAPCRSRQTVTGVAYGTVFRSGAGGCPGAAGGAFAAGRAGAFPLQPDPSGKGALDAGRCPHLGRLHRPVYLAVPQGQWARCHGFGPRGFRHPGLCLCGYLYLRRGPGGLWRAGLCLRHADAAGGRR